VERKEEIEMGKEEGKGKENSERISLGKRGRGKMKQRQ
jgi:hypothetical protein